MSPTNHDCPNCHTPIDSGALFCGTCGQAVSGVESVTQSNGPASQIEQVYANQSAPAAYGQALAPLALAGARGVPAYALPRPGHNGASTKAMLSIVFGVFGLVGMLFLLYVGLALGIIGVVLGTMSRDAPRKALSTIGLVFSILAVVASLGFVAYAVTHNNAVQKSAAVAAKTPDDKTAIAANSVTTACYSAGFSGQLKIATTEGTCNMEAFEGETLNQSNDAYKVYGTNSPTLTAATFAVNAKPAIEKNLHDSLPDFIIDKESVGQFAGSTAYFVNASNKAAGVAVIEAAVLHSGGASDNLFTLVHAIAGKDAADLSDLEAEWQWK